jgi:NADPH-dependent 2,4-dienoyl-CoA reductase/sulfur reductase-like enzyme
VIVGAGFLGMEVAATARSLGAEVTVIETQPGPPLRRAIGATAARRLLERHHQAGVTIRTGCAISEVHRGQRREGECAPINGLELDDSTAVETDLVLVAVGGAPAVEWLEHSSLALDDGIVCDTFSRAGPDVWAAGDAARWMHPELRCLVRLEHRMNATEHGRAVAANILRGPRPFAPIPFFWTDHYDVRLQVAGWLEGHDEAHIVEGDSEGSSFAQIFLRGGQIVGALAWNAPRTITKLRRELAATSAVAAREQGSGCPSVLA